MTETKNQYLLKGDISGIQEFIFNVPTKGAAKTLKARSYYVQILGYLACRFSMKRLKNSRVFYEGGGTFFIEFQATDEKDASEQVCALRNRLHRLLLQDDLMINIAFVIYDQKKFNSTWTALRRKSNIQKLQSLGNESSFFEEFTRKQATGRNEQDPKPQAILKKLGFDLQKGNIYESLIEIMSGKEDILATIFEDGFTNAKFDFDGALSNKLPFWKHYDQLKEYKEYRKDHAQEYPENNELPDTNIIDFDALGDFAAHRTGTNKIGIAKLDIDNLGKLFGSVDSETADNYSNRFSKFFSLHLYSKLFDKKEIRISRPLEKYRANIYPVFAGGDDCFIVGGWDAILCFISDLQHAFKEEFEDIQLGAKPITLSAGIVIVDPTHPVASFADLAESALAKAKINGKNGITLFGLSFTWVEYNHILETSKIIALEIERKTIARAFLDKIRKSAKGFNALQNRGGADFDRIYKLKYYLSRNEKEMGCVVEQLFEPYYNALKNKLLNPSDNDQYNVAIYPAIARITEFLTKVKLKYVEQ